VTTEALTRVDPSDFPAHRDAIAALDATARAADGHESLGETTWRDLAQPAPDSVGFLLESRAYLHVARADGTRRDTHWTAGIVRVPDARDPGTTATLLAASAAHVAAHGGGEISCWVFGATDDDDGMFAAAGFEVARSLYEMRAPLPLPIPDTPRWPPGVEVRSFDPDRDAADWLRVNNLAFGRHPDQGGWTEATRHARMSEPWFDAELLLMAFDADGLAGFNWLKQHPAHGTDPALGEIYVIGVDPRTQGTGLGRALAIAGLHAVHERGSAAALLFCAADNTGALVLYRSLGFSVHRTDRAYVRTVAPVAENGR
jgi:mycothiol synthase